MTAFVGRSITALRRVSDVIKASEMLWQFDIWDQVYAHALRQRIGQDKLFSLMRGSRISNVKFHDILGNLIARETSFLSFAGWESISKESCDKNDTL